MKNYLKGLVLTSAVLGLGLAMPNCPGQQMQQQVDTLQTANADLTRRVQQLTTQLTALNTDMGQVKQLLPSMTNVIQAQKEALNQIDAAVKELQAKAAAAAKPGKKKR